MNRIVEHELSDKVVGCLLEVHSILGPGLLESVYKKGLVRELELSGLKVDSEKLFEVNYKGLLIAQFFADLVVEDTLVIEAKAVKKLLPIHEAQMINYLKISNLPVGYLVNFNSYCLEFKRYVNTE